MAALDFPSSPTLNQIYSANGKAWIWNGVVWNAYSGVGGNSITTSATAPLNPSNGDLWFNTENGLVYVYYVDANSQQWVAPDNSGGFNGGYNPLQAVKTDTEAGTPTTWTDISGLSVTYAAISVTQKITIRAVLMAGNITTADARYRIVNEDGTLVQGDVAGNRMQVHGYSYVNNNSTIISVVMEITITPGTVSNRTYKVQWLRGGTGNIYINRTHTDTDSATLVRSVSTLIIQPH